MKKIYNILIILLLALLLSACELGIPSEGDDFLPDDGIIDDSKTCEHIWDEGVLKEIEGITYKVFNCINCDETKSEEVKIVDTTPSINEYLVDVKRGRLHLYEKLEPSYEPNELIQIKLNPQENLIYRVFVDEEEIKIKEYKKEYFLYEFIMPEKDIQLIIYTEKDSSGFNGEYLPIFISKNSKYPFSQSKPILIENNVLLIDEFNKLHLQEISVEKGMFSFLSDQSIYNQDYSNVLNEIRSKETVYIAYQDKDAIPCYQGEYYNVYYFVKIEDKIIYIPVVKNISNDEVICDAMYTLIASPRKSLFINSYVSYFTVSKVEESSNCAYIINNKDEFNELASKYDSHFKEIEYYNIYTKKYDDTYFENNQLFVFLFDVNNSETTFTIHGGSLQSNYHDYSMRVVNYGEDEMESTRMVIIEYQFNKKRIESISLKCNSQGINVKSEKK